MTCYLLPMGEPENIFQIHILRFNPETDREPHWETYSVPHVKTMTVMEALENLWDQGEYIAFRSNCKEFTCGSCSMIINGKPRLACDTLLEDGMRLEPLTRYPVINSTHTVTTGYTVATSIDQSGAEPSWSAPCRCASRCARPKRTGT